MRNRPGGYSGYEIRWSGENTARGLGGAMTRVPPEPRISMPLDMHNQPQFVAFAQSRNEATYESKEAVRHAIGSSLTDESWKPALLTMR